jgi:hypothetical protein
VEPGGMPMARPQGRREISVPQALVATAGPNGEVLLTWNAPWGDEAMFEIESTSGPRVRAQVGPAGRTFQKEGLAPGEAVGLKVRACRKDECSEYSQPITITAPATDIAAPTNLRMERVDEKSARLLWVASAPQAEYIVERQRGSHAEYEPVSRSIASSEVIIPFNASDAADTFRIRACIGGQCSAHSNVLSAAEWVPKTDHSPKTLMLPLDLRQKTYVEGLTHSKDLSSTGRIEAHYSGDLIDVQMEPSNSERFLVLNEMYHPRWKAFAGAQELEVLPANTVMRGVFVAPGVTHITFKFEPFLYTRQGAAIIFAGLMLAFAVAIGMYRFQRRTRA